MKKSIAILFLMLAFACGKSKEAMHDEKADNAVKKLDALLQLDQNQKDEVKKLAIIGAELMSQAEEENKSNPKKIMALKHSIGKSFDQKLVELLSTEQKQKYLNYKNNLKAKQLETLEKQMKSKGLKLSDSLAKK